MAIDGTFAVTAMGRSGTMFLAQALNKSKTWTVKHEPVAGFRPIEEVSARFARRNYGEVNSWLRFQLPYLPVARKAVIVRNPLDIFASIYNRGNTDMVHLNEALIALDEAIQDGTYTIQFSRMTTDRDYLRNIGVFLGVKDLPSPVSMSPCNRSRQYLQMPAQLLRRAEKNTDWFRKLYERLY